MPSYYGRISSNSQESIPHFVKEMKITEKDLEKDLEDPERDPRWTPISIPCIIIRLFGQFVLYVAPSPKTTAGERLLTGSDYEMYVTIFDTTTILFMICIADST